RLGFSKKLDCHLAAISLHVAFYNRCRTHENGALCLLCSRAVGERLVEPGEIITIDFSGGPQGGDAGPKDFWVIFSERDAYVAHWRHGEDPGDRFRIMEKWLRGHPKDARFAGAC